MCARVCMCFCVLCVCFGAYRNVYMHLCLCVYGLFYLLGVRLVCDAVQYFTLLVPQSFDRDPRKCCKLTQPAVNGVCVGVRRGECFGLLGINGECDSIVSRHQTPLGKAAVS